jgi:hypothetical protein
MPIRRTGDCPLFLDYVTRQALIPRSDTPQAEFVQLTKYNFRWIDIPSYQRGLVWDEEDFSSLLNSNSVFMGNAILGSFLLPVSRGTFALLPDSATTYEILIDGLQRFSIGTAVLNILHTMVLAAHPLRSPDAPHFGALRTQAVTWAPVYQHNDRELQAHNRKAIRDSYADFRQALANWIESEFNQGRAADLATKIEHLFLQRQIAPDTYYGFQSEYDVTSTFIGLNTIRVQLNIVDWLRSVIVDRGSASGWSSAELASIDNRFTEVFTRGNSPAPDLMPFAAIVLECLTRPSSTKPQHAKAIFPSWEAGLQEPEVVRFLEFVEEIKSSGGNAYFREIRQCGKIPFAGVICYYYRHYLATAQLPSFLNGGIAEDVELHAYLRANYRALFAGRIGRTRIFSERLLREQISLHDIANELSVFAVDRDLGTPIDGDWLAATLKISDQNRAPRIFNACLLPRSTSPGAMFEPHAYGKRATTYQVDHLIAESVILANQPGEQEARTLINFAPIRRPANNAQGNISCAAKLADGGSYANECINDDSVHPYVEWLVATQSNHGAFLDQQERLQPNSVPPIAQERIQWFVNELSERL